MNYMAVSLWCCKVRQAIHQASAAIRTDQSALPTPKDGHPQRSHRAKSLHARPQAIPAASCYPVSPGDNYPPRKSALDDDQATRTWDRATRGRHVTTSGGVPHSCHAVGGTTVVD